MAREAGTLLCAAWQNCLIANIRAFKYKIIQARSPVTKDFCYGPQKNVTL